MIFMVGWDKRQLSRAGPPFWRASIGGPALAFARWSHPAFCRFTNLFYALLQSCTIFDADAIFVDEAVLNLYDLLDLYKTDGRG